MRGLAFVSFLALIGLFISLTRFLYIVLSSYAHGLFYGIGIGGSMRMCIIHPFHHP